MKDRARALDAETIANRGNAASNSQSMGAKAQDYVKTK